MFEGIQCRVLLRAMESTKTELLERVFYLCCSGHSIQRSHEMYSETSDSADGEC